MIFSLRTMMIDLKGNDKNDKTYKAEKLRCDACKNDIETQSHVLVCPAYDELREGLVIENVDDQVKYFRKVLKKRMDENKKG